MCIAFVSVAAEKRFGAKICVIVEHPRHNEQIRAAGTCGYHTNCRLTKETHKTSKRGLLAWCFVQRDEEEGLGNFNCILACQCRSLQKNITTS